VKLYLAGRPVILDPTQVLGKGGEADVYDLGDGRALKVFKGPRHPDLAGQPAEQAAARARIDEHQHKLRAFPAGLPPRVIVPGELATARARGKRVAGYAMRKVDGAQLLARFANPRSHRVPGAAERALATLRDLRATVAALHRAGVVIGDFNDLNVLVSGDRAYLIDADSYQFGPYRCRVFTERFVDPTLCDRQASAPVLTRAHTASSDWYAFEVIAFRTLLCVDPYGGVYRPADRSRTVAHARRPLERITVMHPEVIYPKPAVPLASLPDDLLAHFDGVFAGDARAPFPARLLDELRWTRCLSCGREHARSSCPVCLAGGRAARATVVVRGAVTAEVVAEAPGIIVDARLGDSGPAWIAWNGAALVDHRGLSLAGARPASGRRVLVDHGGALVAEAGRARVHAASGAGEPISVDSCAGEPCVATNGRHRYWVRAGRLYRNGVLGDVGIGDVLAGQTRIWVGDDLGFGCYRAGTLAVGFVFDPERGGLRDDVALPRPRGVTLDVACALAADRVWLTVFEQAGPRMLVACYLFDRAGRLLASWEEPLDERSPLAGAAGACAVGSMLLVPTDDGVVRLEADGAALRVSKRFSDTEPFVDRACRLLAGPAGLFVVNGRRITRLTLSS